MKRFWKRLEAQKDSIQDSVSYGIKPGIKKEPAHDQDANVNPSEAFIPERHLTLRQRMREFSRFHGLPKRDAVFFNESDLLVDMAKKEDFVILGRCGDAIMANNNIPHISIYITAPFEQRIKRAMEIDSSPDGQAGTPYVKASGSCPQPVLSLLYKPKLGTFQQL